MIEWEGGAKELYGTPLHPPSVLSQPPSTVAFLYAAAGAAAKCPVHFRWPRLCSQVATDPPFPVFPHTLACAALLRCPARVRRGSVRSEGVVVVRRKKTGPCFIGRIRRRQTRDKKGQFLPALLAGRQGSGCLQAPEGRHAGVVPSRPNMQALVAAAADTRSQLFRNLFVPHAGHLTRRDAPRDRCLESDIHGRSRNMQLVPASHGIVCA